MNGSAVNIHPELRSIKAHSLPRNRWALAAMQNLLSAVNALHRRKFKPFFTRTTIPSSDGYPVPIWIIQTEKLKSPAPALVYYHGGAFVAVGGDSAGGGLAAGVAQRAPQEDDISVRGQLLINPCVDLPCNRQSAFSSIYYPILRRQ
jgi:acetyl esterase/lipase